MGYCEYFYCFFKVLILILWKIACIWLNRCYYKLYTWFFVFDYMLFILTTSIFQTYWDEYASNRTKGQMFLYFCWVIVYYTPFHISYLHFLKLNPPASSSWKFWKTTGFYLLTVNWRSRNRLSHKAVQENTLTER